MTTVVVVETGRVVVVPVVCRRLDATQLQQPMTMQRMVGRITKRDESDDPTALPTIMAGEDIKWSFRIIGDCVLKLLPRQPSCGFMKLWGTELV